MSGKPRPPCPPVALAALLVLALVSAGSQGQNGNSGTMGTGHGQEAAGARSREDTAGARETHAKVDSGAPRRAENPERAVRIAVVQAGTNHYSKGNPGPEANFTLLADLARQAAAAQPRPDLVCFPEYAISGWPYPSEERINSLAEPIPGSGQWYQRYRNLAREIGVTILASLVESSEGRKYNTSFAIDGQGSFRGKYRKVHANLGEQTWWGWSQGDRFELIELDGVFYGVSICADMFFPETVRCEELLGADVILHQSIGDDMGHIVPARAFDSKLPIVMSIFQGGSYAVDAQGKLLAKLSSTEPAWKTFTLFPFRRHLGRMYGGLWDRESGDRNLRNVWAYSVLTDPARRPPWTEVFMDDDGHPQTREQLLKRFGGRYDAHDPSPPGAPGSRNGDTLPTSRPQ
jgi:predicted amidohydrolase